MNIDESVDGVRKAAYWFFGIAGLSIINTFLASKGAAFILGLGIGQLIDTIIIMLTGEVNYFISFLAPAIFIAIGIFAARLNRWAFIVGSIIYLFDAFLYLLFQSWLAFGFHLFILYKLYHGYRTIAEYDALRARMMS